MTLLPADLELSVQRALEEDIGSGDLSAALIAPTRRLRAHILAREPGVLCGRPYAEAVLRHCSPEIRCQWRVAEGMELAADTVLCELEGPAGPMLTAERTALNFLQLLSGTATRVRQHVQLLEGLPARLLDTRKTLPGLRLAQKYAVRMGGGNNHRLGLFDGILIKENHIAAMGGIGPALRAARALVPALTRIEIEVENLDQLEEALAERADIILLDNFSLADLRRAVELVQGRVPLEASGNLGLHNLRAVAATGVDYLSVGSLTRDVQSLDLSLRYCD